MALIVMALLSSVVAIILPSPASAELRLPAAPSWGTNTAKNLRVRALARLGDTLYVGGEFTQIMPMPGGPVVAQPYLFAVDAATGVWRSQFAPAITAPAGTELDPSGVLAIETDPATGSVFVGGKFSSVNGQPVTSFAVLDATTGMLKPGVVQRPATRSGSALAVVEGLHRVGTKLYVGGLFEQLGGVGRARVARLELGTPGFALDGWTVAVQGGEVLTFADDPAFPTRIYLGGKFTSAGSASDPRAGFLAAFDITTSNNLLPWFPQPDGGDKPGWVLGLDAAGGRVYAGIAGGGGQFNVYSGTIGAPRLMQEQFRATGNIQAVNVIGNVVYVGGHHDDFRDPVIPQGKLNAFDANTLEPVALPVSVNGAWGIFAIEGDVAGDVWFGGQISGMSSASGSQSQGNLVHLREGQVADNQAPAAPARPAVSNGLFTNVDVAWPAATDNGVVLAYYVYVNGTLSRVTSGADRGVRLSGLAPGTPYQVTVRALDGGRNLSPASAAASITTGAAAPSLPNPLNGYGQYYPVNPSRILDTRSGLGAEAAGAVVGGQPKRLRVAGVGGVAPSGVQAVALNVTVTQPSTAGFVTVYPGGEAPPATSNLNFVAGQTVPNLVIARVGADGTVNLWVSGGQAHLVADVVGWFGSAQTPAAGGSRITPLSPQRVLDTRPASRIGSWGGVGPGQTIEVAVVPPGTGVTGVVLNLTGTEPTSSTYVSAFPADAAQPTVSNLNLLPGETRPNLVLVRVPANGRIKLFNLAGTTHLIADVVATFAPAADTTPAGRILPLDAPLRLLDTRAGAGPLAGPGARTTSFRALDDATPGNLRGLVMNLTATEPTQSTHLTVYPGDAALPLASNVNPQRGQTVPNLAVARLSAADDLAVYNHSGAVHYLVDVAALVLG